MDWQEAAVATIVGYAVLSLYRHMRGIFAMPKSGGGGAACHGCDDCGSEEAGGPAASTGGVAPHPTATIH